MSFWRTNDFKKLKESWYKKLKADGFKDIESDKEEVKRYDHRTWRWKNKEQVLDFFLALDTFLHSGERIPHKHRIILEGWTNGESIKEINQKVDYKADNIFKVMVKYRARIIHFMRVRERELEDE